MKSIDIPKETISSKKIYISGTLFKGQTFSIVNRTYKQEQILEMKEKIEGNSGEYFDSGNATNPGDFKAKYIILNDGHPTIWNNIIQKKLFLQFLYNQKANYTLLFLDKLQKYLFYFV